MITGGGAFNEELVRRLEQDNPIVHNDLPLKAFVPDKSLLQGKEAYAFGFLGLLRWLELDNVWAHATGCGQSHMGGALWGKNGLSSSSSKETNDH